jgi:hypothetical protein
MQLQAGFETADITPAHGDLIGFIARRQPTVGGGIPLQAHVLLLALGRRDSAALHDHQHG